jgi:hypothetical protein
MPDIECLIIGNIAFGSNPLWDLVSSKATSYNSYGASYYQCVWMGEVTMKRISSGIVLRLVSPVLLLVLLCASTFWMVEDKRIDVTITFMLSVSALYIVLVANIPLVGYLTELDVFIFRVITYPIPILSIYLMSSWYLLSVRCL